MSNSRKYFQVTTNFPIKDGIPHTHNLPSLLKAQAEEHEKMAKACRRTASIIAENSGMQFEVSSDTYFQAMWINGPQNVFDGAVSDGVIEIDPNADEYDDTVATDKD